MPSGAGAGRCLGKPVVTSHSATLWRALGPGWHRRARSRLWPAARRDTQGITGPPLAARATMAVMNRDPKRAASCRDVSWRLCLLPDMLLWLCPGGCAPAFDPKWDCPSRGRRGHVLRWIAAVARIEIHLYGVDCPETAWKDRWPAQPWSDAAKQFTVSKALHNKVSVRLTGERTHGRDVGEAFVDGQSLSRELLRLASPGGTKNLPATIKTWRALKRRRKPPVSDIWSTSNPIPPGAIVVARLMSCDENHVSFSVGKTSRAYSLKSAEWQL